ncbi:hypothetical protein SLS63_013871 [Diaporthe eres]|uniref:TauD/TfdA-like domain-containing protein n=1 Tax=Diaporthe eres TaxID=83184 RepID=A0ABR1NM87_DIAER
MGSIARAFRPAPYGPSVNLPDPYPRDTEFPLSLASNKPNADILDLIAEVEELSSSGDLGKLLNKHGAIYFQGLGLKNADEFSQFAHAFGWAPHEDIGNPVRRVVHAKNVASANEGPNTQPTQLISKGGETPINNSIILYRRLKDRHPEFIDELEKKGVKYQLYYDNAPRDQTSSARNSVLQAYGGTVLDSDDTETARAKVETEIRRLPTATWSWENQSESNKLGDLRVWQHLPGDTAFFNNVVSRFCHAVEAGTLEPPHINSKGAFQPPALFLGRKEMFYFSIIMPYSMPESLGQETESSWPVCGMNR